MSKPQQVKSLVENCAIVCMAAEALENVINDPDDILALIEGDSGLISYMKNINCNTFFQNISSDLHDRIVDVSCFVLEAEKEARFLEHGRRIKIDGMLGREANITTDSVRIMYEMGLTKFLFYIQELFMDTLERYKDDVEALEGADREEIVAAADCITNLDWLHEKQKEYVDVDFEEYIGVTFGEDDDEEVDGFIISPSADLGENLDESLFSME